jgi:hypothetical protein
MSDDQNTQTEGTPEAGSAQEPVSTTSTPDPLVTEAAGAQVDAGDDEAYEDVLYAALKKVYDEMGAEGDNEVTIPDATGTAAPKPIEQLSIEELRTALQKTNSTLKEVVKLTLQDREEEAAVNVWNDFIEKANPIEQEIAKAAPFEVDDAKGMQEQIKRIKAQAAAAARVIEEQTGVKVQEQVGSLKRQYGIITPDPTGTKPSMSEQDEKDMKAGNREAVISRRFAKLRGRA